MNSSELVDFVAGFAALEAGFAADRARLAALERGAGNGRG